MDPQTQLKPLDADVFFRVASVTSNQGFAAFEMRSSRGRKAAKKCEAAVRFPFEEAQARI
jgi:hypothetical protein